MSGHSSVTACVLFLFLVSLAAAQWTAVTPPTTSAYLNNGMSGLYKWYSSTLAPLPNRDYYWRWSWRELEPTQGNYDFRDFDAKIAEAKNSFKGKFGFRVMVADTWAGGKSVPDYFATSANGWTCHALKNTWVPNWNSAALLNRLTALFDAISARYKDDARLMWVDVGLYGNYGEWHNAELRDAGCFPGPNGWGDATKARKQAFIDLVTSRFPNKFVVINTNDVDGLCIALSGTRLGLRGDTFSDSSWSSERGDPLYELYRRQYRSAPFISEFSTGPDFTHMKQQAMEDHRVNVGNGNFLEWQYQSAAQKSAFLAAAPFIGPRLRLSSANYSTSIAPGGCLTVTLTFINDGSARVYEKYNTLIQLRSKSTNTIAWTSTSVLDVRNVLPKNDGMASFKGTNSFSIPADLATGSYNLVVLVKDPTNYRPNFYLAVSGANSDISYTLGSITVTKSAPKPTTCKTTTPSYKQPKYAIGPGVNSWNDHPVGPLYTDFLFWGWEEELNGATGNIASTEQVWGSSGKSIKFTSKWAWGIWGMRFSVCYGIDLTGYKYVHFRMRAASSNSGKVFFYPYMSPWDSPASIDLANYGGDPVASGWKNYNIPLSAFAGLPKKVDHLVFGAYNSGASFFIDDISFTDNIIS